ncbi:AAA-family ATPase [Fragilaria crotonensis]|nr:AAA-family ATPase [Fragilaria crotonensis]
MKCRTCSNLSLVVLLQWSLVASAFSPIYARSSSFSKHSDGYHAAEPDSEVAADKPDLAQNEIYIQGLINNLTTALDRWVVTVLQSRRESKSDALIVSATRLAQSAGFPLDDNKELGKTDAEARRKGVDARKEWEEFREAVEQVGQLVGRTKDDSRSALTSRRNGDRKRDLFMGDVDDRLVPDNLEKDAKQEPIVNVDTASKINGLSMVSPSKGPRNYFKLGEDALVDAQLRTSEMVAKSGADFDGEMLGIGGLDEVLAQVKRRIWVPLAAPPVLLQELGISPVRGLLLYGMPGCGKTLIARTIGRILSPVRPVTVVSGPELMDKFVGSSEQNVRKVFDSPPNLRPCSCSRG